MELFDEVALSQRLGRLTRRLGQMVLIAENFATSKRFDSSMPITKEEQVGHM